MRAVVVGMVLFCGIAQGAELKTITNTTERAVAVREVAKKPTKKPATLKASTEKRRTALAVLLFLIICGGALAAGITFLVVQAKKDAETMRYGTPKAKAALIERNHTFTYGKLYPEMVCPHCQVKGKVRCQPVKNKKGISGGKAVAALLTGGASMLVTGLSRKEASTAAYCGNCTSVWGF